MLDVPELSIVFRPISALDHGPMKGGKPSGITVHYTADGDLDRTIQSCASSRIGYHYIIDRDGTIVQICRDVRSTWHAGPAAWNGVSPNLCHLAVAVVAWGALDVDEQDDGPIYKAWDGLVIPPGEVEWRASNITPTLHPWHVATSVQEEQLDRLLRRLMKAYAITPGNVCDHAECALPKGRKVDIGGTLSLSMLELRKKLRGAV